MKTSTFLYSDNKLSQRESELNQLTATYTDLDKEKQPRGKSSQGGEKTTWKLQDTEKGKGKRIWKTFHVRNWQLYC